MTAATHRSTGCGILLLALLGCSRSAVVVVPEGQPHADEPTAARGKAEEPERSGFRFPDDSGGALLARVLPPRPPEEPRLERAERPGRPRAVASLTPPALPLPPSHAVLPRLPERARTSLTRPRVTFEETLPGLFDAGELPEAPSLPAGRRVRVPSRDVHEPTPLPILARPASDRASLDDPTLEASTAAALAARLPRRAAKAPFLKLTVPDPYDGRRGEPAAPAESQEFPLGTPQSPGR